MKASLLQTPKTIARMRSRQIQPEGAAVVKHDKVVSRSLDDDFTVEAALYKMSDLTPNQSKNRDKIVSRLSDSDSSVESHLFLSDLPDPVPSPAESVITSDLSDTVPSPAESIIIQEEPAHRVLESPEITNLDASSRKSLSREDKYRSEINLIMKALEETSKSEDISKKSKKIIDAMFEAAIEQLKGETNAKRNGSETGTKRHGSTRPVQIAKVRIGTLILFIIMFMWLILVHLINIWCTDGQDWPIPPT